MHSDNSDVDDGIKYKDVTEKNISLNVGEEKADDATKPDGKVLFLKSQLLVNCKKLQNDAVCKYGYVERESYSSKPTTKCQEKLKPAVPPQENSPLKPGLKTLHSDSLPEPVNKKLCLINGFIPKLNKNLYVQHLDSPTKPEEKKSYLSNSSDSELNGTFDSKHPKTSPKAKERKSCQLMDGNFEFEQGLDIQPQNSLPGPIQERHSLGYLKTSDKKIGFLGLGVIGKCIVTNLLKSGHNVTVYNRSQSKCNEVVKKGASQVNSPAEVIITSDITFCCVSGPEASKSLFFSKNGVLTGLKNCKDANKGYVELSSIDEETSKLLALQVTSAGGAYLEAPMNGMIEGAEEAELIIAGAGSKALFKSCETVFPAFAKCFFFISKEVGKATVMNLGVNMLNGAFIVSFWETKICSPIVDVYEDDLVDTMEMLGYSCPLTTKLKQSFRGKKFYSLFSPKRLQSQMQLGLDMKISKILPMPVLSTANEILKREKHGQIMKVFPKGIFDKGRQV